VRLGTAVPLGRRRLRAATAEDRHTPVHAAAFKWQHLHWKYWQPHSPCGDASYETSRRQHGSPVMNWFNQIELGRSPVNKADHQEPKY